MDSRRQRGASGSLWRDALKAGRKWWLLALVLMAGAALFGGWWGGGSDGVTGSVTSMVSLVGRIALIVGLGVGALAVLRIGTKRIADWPVADGGTNLGERRRRLQTLARVAWRAGATVIVCVTGMMVLANFIQIAPILAAATVGGLALTLASQKLLKDLLAGGEFLLDDAAAVGEWVTVLKITGRVQEFGLRALTIDGFDGTRHRIANSAIVELSNHSRNPAAVLLEVEVGYTDDPGWLVAILNEEAERLGAEAPGHDWVQGNPVPLGVHTLADDKLTARVRVPCLPFGGPTLARIWRDRIGARLADEGRAISPPFAVRVVDIDEPGPRI